MISRPGKGLPVHGRNAGFALAVVTLFAVGGCGTNPADDSPLPEPVIPGRSLEDLSAEYLIDLSAPLDGRAVAAITVLVNPDLRAIRLREQVAQAQVFASGLLPDPGFSLGADYPAGGNGLVSAIAASLSLDVAALIRRPALRRSAEAGLDAVRLEILWAEWLASQQARIQVARIEYLGQTKMLTAQLRRVTDDELARALAAAIRGDLPNADVDARRLAAADAAARDRELESQLVQARLALNRSLGIEPGESLQLADTVASFRVSEGPADIFKHSLRKRADLRALKARYKGTRSDWEVTRLGRYPLPVISLNAARDTGDVRTLGPGVAVNLPLWNAGRGDAAVAIANRQQLHAEYIARVETVRADIAAAHAALEVALKQWRESAERIHELSGQVEAASRAVARGDLSESAGSALQLVLLDRKIVARDLELAAIELRIALEIVAGYTLDESL